MTRQQKNVPAARSLRKKIVPAERLLWGVLRNRGLGGVKFRRQHPIGGYVVDFACVECRLIVELDGESHLSTRTKDETRTSFLESQGWIVLRYWNTQIYDDLEPMREDIYRRCMSRQAAE